MSKSLPLTLRDQQLSFSSQSEMIDWCNHSQPSGWLEGDNMKIVKIIYFLFAALFNILVKGERNV